MISTTYVFFPNRFLNYFNTLLQIKNTLTLIAVVEKTTTFQ